MKASTEVDRGKRETTLGQKVESAGGEVLDSLKSEHHPNKQEKMIGKEMASQKRAHTDLVKMTSWSRKGLPDKQTQVEEERKSSKGQRGGKRK